MGIFSWIKRWREGAPELATPAQAEQVSALCATLRELVALLDDDGESHWQGWMATALAQLEANDLRGARHLRQAYGGMGSFNDLVIGQRMVDGAFAWTEGAQAANESLDRLRSHAYTLASALIGET